MTRIATANTEPSGDFAAALSRRRSDDAAHRRKIRKAAALRALAAPAPKRPPYRDPPRISDEELKSRLLRARLDEARRGELAAKGLEKPPPEGCLRSDAIRWDALDNRRAARLIVRLFRDDPAALFGDEAAGEEEAAA